MFVASRQNAEYVNDFLVANHWSSAYFHAGLAANEKADVQERFIRGDLRVIVATNAFGMGVDKPDVRVVIHAQIPGSLENYLQEAGRAGRDQLQARCILLFEPRDVETQFRLHHQSQLTFKDLRTIWRRLRSYQVKQERQWVLSSGEIMGDAELSFEKGAYDADTKVKAALAWLEKAHLLVRLENRTRIFPAKIQHLPLEQALAKIRALPLSQRKMALFCAVTEMIYRSSDDEVVNTDQLMAATASSFVEISTVLHELEEVGVLMNDVHMTIYVRTDHHRPARNTLAMWWAQEEALWAVLPELIAEADTGAYQNFALSAACQALRERAVEMIPADLKRLLRVVAEDKHPAKSSSGSLMIRDMGQDMLRIRLKYPEQSWADIAHHAALRRYAARLILAYVLEKAGDVVSKDTMVSCSLKDLTKTLQKDEYLSTHIEWKQWDKFVQKVLLAMHRLNVLTINHGMTVLRHAMTIQMQTDEQNQRLHYRKDDYWDLEKFYQGKTFQIHVMLEYAHQALRNMALGWQLVRDYFQSDDRQFKNKWFRGRAEELKHDTSPQTLREICDGLNPIQHRIVTGSDENRLVLAGPGSGKTRVIVHRVAYLLRVRHVLPTAIIVLTFNRHAAYDIRQRLWDLVGHMALAVTVLTYDSMAMRLLGVRFDNQQFEFSSEQLREWNQQAAQMLSGSLNPDEWQEADERRNQILQGFRYILVDEYQDINYEQYQLVAALAGRQSGEDADSKLTILAVGDDDQNIYAWRDTSNDYIHQFCQDYQVKAADFLVYNYRSNQNIITAANQVIANAPERLKMEHPICINPEREHEAAGGIWQQHDPLRQGRVWIGQLPTVNQQTQAIFDEIARLRALSVSWNWQDCAILSRTNQGLNAAQAYCEQRAIPYALRGQQPFAPFRHRSFARMLLQIEKARVMKADDFVSLLQQSISQSDEIWANHWQTLITLFQQQSPEQQAEQDASSLKEWLYEQIGSMSEIRAQKLFLGTVHAAKGLEFRHVFILDDAWQHSSVDEQRLYYVGMTRAKETLTLFQKNPHHLWLRQLHDGDYPVVFDGGYSDLPELNKQYHVMQLRELVMDFVVGEYLYWKPMRCAKEYLRVLSQIAVGDTLQLSFDQDKWLIYHVSSGQKVAQLSKYGMKQWPSLPDWHRQQQLTLTVADFYTRYASDVKDEWRERLGLSRCDELKHWVVVIPKMVVQTA